jgi:plastocyanin
MKTQFSLLLAVGLLAACSTSESDNEPIAVPHDVTITQGAQSKGANAFSPGTFTVSIAAQTTVNWQNRDFSGSGYNSPGVTHRLVSDDGLTFASGNIPSNGTFEFSLTAPGSIGYHCSIHPAMTGTLTVNP